MLLPDGDEVEAIATAHVPLMDFFGNCLPKCCHTHAPMHGTGPSRKLSNIRYLRPTMVLPILIGTSGNVAAGTHMPQHKRSACGTVQNPQSRTQRSDARHRAVCAQTKGIFRPNPVHDSPVARASGSA